MVNTSEIYNNNNNNNKTLGTHLVRSFICECSGSLWSLGGTASRKCCGLNLAHL